MQTSSVESILCPKCLAPVKATARVCGACGVVFGPDQRADSGPSSPDTSAPTTPRLQDRRWFVIAIVFGAALFLGYPILWSCPSFSRGQKVVLSLLVAVETVLVFWGFYLVMRWSILRVIDSW